MLELNNITKTYAAVEAGDAAAPAQPVLRGVTARIETGESVAIVGPSGCGKSTLLHIIGTLDVPTSGTVILDGQDLTRLDSDATAKFRSGQVGFIFQSHHLLPQCSVLENVLIPTLVADGERKADGEARARKLLGRVGLAERMAHRPGQLSGGESQRVAVVRALINQPKLLLADEPTGALDEATADTLSKLLIDLNKEEGVTLIVVTHSLPLAQRMGKVLQLKNGELVE